MFKCLDFDNNMRISFTFACAISACHSARPGNLNYDITNYKRGDTNKIRQKMQMNTIFYQSVDECGFKMW